MRGVCRRAPRAGTIKGPQWVETISNSHENKVVQQKFDRTKNQTSSLTVVWIRDYFERLVTGSNTISGLFLIDLRL